MGNYKHAREPHVIESLGITHILNVTQSVDNFLAASHSKSLGCSLLTEHLKYLKIEVPDETSSIIDQYFDAMFNFIDSALGTPTAEPSDATLSGSLVVNLMSGG